jgi:hypothetical protein
MKTPPIKIYEKNFVNLPHIQYTVHITIISYFSQRIINCREGGKINGKV